MASLVASIGDDQASWGQIRRLIKAQEWEHVYLIGGEGAGSFTADRSFDLILIDQKKPVKDLINDITAHLKGKFSFSDVGVNLVSGSGKDHMAILASLLKLGIGIRLVAVTKDGFEEL